MDIQEMLRLMQKGYSNQQVAQALQINRKTVDKYHKIAQQAGWLAGKLPELAEVEEEIGESLPHKAAPQNISTVEPYRAEVEKLREQGVEIAAIRQRLIERHGYTGSYAAVWRFVRKLEVRPSNGVVRIEVKPGEEAQVDFGSAGKMFDPQTGKEQRAWVFVMTLSYSRHQYAIFVFDQKVNTWLRCHRQAFEFFGGVPERVLIDNLKAAIVRACWEDP